MRDCLRLRTRHKYSPLMQDLTMNAYLSHLKKLKRQTSSKNVLGFLREDLLRGAEEKSDTSARDNPMQPGLKKSIFSQQAQSINPLKAHMKGEPTEGKQKLSLFKIALEKNASKGDSCQLPDIIPSMQSQNQPQPQRTESRRKSAENGPHNLSHTPQSPKNRIPNPSNPIKTEYESDRSEDIENLSNKAKLHIDVRHESKQPHCLPHHSSDRSISEDSQISEIEPPNPASLQKYSTFKQGVHHSGIDYSSSSDSADLQQDLHDHLHLDPYQHSASSKVQEAGPTGKIVAKEKLTIQSAAIQSNSRNRRTFQHFSRDCRNLVPEI